MHFSLLFLVSLVVAVSCHPLLFHLEKNHPLSPDLICPDHVSQCADGSTCCLLKAVEGYGCCPQPQAACCDDGIHCCPHTYTCSNSNTCSKGDITVPATKRLPATTTNTISAGSIPSSARRRIVDIMCPDDHSECPSTETCCLTSDYPHTYGCCPKPNAVCCADGKHCCPSGYTCDLSAGTCESYDSSIPMIEKRPPAVNVAPPVVKEQRQTITTNKPQNIMCSDKKTQCLDGDTCCKLPSGKGSEYGCCPMTNAICCSDGIHCCPSTYTCNISGEICSKGSAAVPLVKKVQGVRMAPQNVVCPDSETECAEGSTCCKLKSGEYACCPLADAICCSDGVHCCPKTYTCDTKDDTCTKGDRVIAMFKKQPAVKKPKQSIDSLKVPQNIICPDKESECASNATCCLLKSGVYGCCPIPFAVCCEDGSHCCPNDYACQEGTGMCVDRGTTIAAFKKQPALRREKSGALLALVKVKNEPESSLTSIVGKSQVVTCPDGASICPDAYTCCRNASGGFGCCPHVNAVCCDDHKHCCSEDYTCDPSSGSCVNGDFVLPLSKKIPATTMRASQNIMCPDEKTQCYSNNTCCKLESGDYGCCPTLDATCCADGVHCCPLGTTCDLIGRKCRETELFSKLGITTTTVTQDASPNIVCPDQQNECLSNETCCALTSGEDGCCPLKNAVCCGDGKSCCPSGTTCDVDSQKCLARDSFIPPLKLSEKPLQYNYCPDGSYCSYTETCCELSWGDYGCCPHFNAECCSDDKHCCPSGSYCDLYSDKCISYTSSVPVTKKQRLLTTVPTAALAQARAQARNSALHLSNIIIICPNGQDECSDDTTCCQLSSGSYGCCPVQNAICCADGSHCCPQGYSCNTDAGTCSKDPGSVVAILKHTDNLRQKTVSDEKLKLKLKSVVCPDKKSECPSDTTCCLQRSGIFGCCPVPNAICCNDSKHCCPSGYTCEVASGKCTLGDRAIKMLTKQSAMITKSEEKLKNVVCPDQKSECPSQQTCCKLTLGEYACCPLASAVCCSDGRHCCPSSYKCGAEGTCTKGKDSAVRALLTELSPRPPSPPPSSVGEPYNNVRCYETQYYCQSGHKCCQSTTPGVYKCCKIQSPYAVCCTGRDGCCPEGNTCPKDPKSNNCIPNVASRYPFLKPKSLTYTATKQRGVMKIAALVPSTVKQPTTTSMFKTEPAFVKTPQNVVCPDQESECGDNSTCCLLNSGTYGCCPEPKAICCDDKEHCCPEGFECKSEGTCAKGDKIVAMLKKQPAIIKKSQNVICPDQQSECSTNSTCCLLESGTYGCCPIPKAVCCKDQQHCCPESYSCKPGKGTCTKGDLIVTMLKKQPAILKTTPPQSGSSPVTCPDKSTCPDSSTCCKLKTGQYGCCPQTSGVCCADEVHCCPTGFTCDLNKGTCTKGDGITAPFLAKLAVALATVEVPEGVIKCPDGGYCQDTSTCCLLESGRYGCCPQVQAICCSDKEHCCPQNYVCQPTTNTCNKGSSVVPMLKKLPSFSSAQDAIAARKEEPQLISKSQNVICPDQRSECPKDNTCCLTAGTYRCCPGLNAVCCGDRMHCCPEGYTCHVPTKTCTKGDAVVPMLKKSPSVQSSLKEVQEVEKELLPSPPHVRVNSPLSVICPNHQSQCPNGNTCCQSDGSSYNCCPTPNAVCCPDKKHCCPNHYVCNVENESCDDVERGVAIPFMEITNSAVDDIVEMTRDIL